MADAFRLSPNPRLFSSSPVLLIFHSSSNAATQLPILSKQLISDGIGISLPAEDSAAAAAPFLNQRKRLSSFKAHVVVAQMDDEPKWWEKNAGPNMIDIHSTEDFSAHAVVAQKDDEPKWWEKNAGPNMIDIHSTEDFLVVAQKDDEPKWWEKNAGLNMIDIHSTEDFLGALSQAGDKLVIVEFYGTWCGSCRALFPKLCKTAEEHPDILFLKVNFDENKPMCKSLNVKVLPYFHFYRGANGQLESFSCSLAKFQKIKDAIEKHNTSRCSLGPPLGVGDANLLGASSSVD